MTNVTNLNPNLNAPEALRNLAEAMEVEGATQECTVIVGGEVYQLGPSRDQAADALWAMALGIKNLLSGE